MTKLFRKASEPASSQMTISSIVKKVNNKESKKQRPSSSEQKKVFKDENVYDRLYASRRNVKWFTATQPKV